MNDRDAISAACDHLIREVDALYGHYLDSTTGYAQLVAMVEGTLVVPLPGAHPDVGRRMFTYGAGSPNDPSNRILVQSSLGEVLARNRKGGRNHKIAARLLVFMLYEQWEGVHRQELADAIGLERDSLKVPIFGDLRLIRHDVTHCRGIVSKRTFTQLSVLSGFKEGEPVDLAPDDVEFIVRAVKTGLDELVIGVTGVDPKHRTLWRLR